MTGQTSGVILRAKEKKTMKEKLTKAEIEALTYYELYSFNLRREEHGAN